MSHQTKSKRSRPFDAKWPGTCKKCGKPYKAKAKLVYENDIVVHETCPSSNGKTFRQMLTAASSEPGENAEILDEENSIPEIIHSSKPFTPSKYQQAVGDFALEGKGNAVIEAVAGSGKTTTIVWLLSLLDPSLRILFLAFNKHIVKELKRRVPRHIHVRTVHSLGLSIIRKLEDFDQRDGVDQDKVSEILNEFWPVSRKQLEAMSDRDLQDKFGISRIEIQQFISKNRIRRQGMRKLVSLVKATLADYDEPDQLLNLINRYNIDIDEQMEQEIIERVPYVMKMNNGNLTVVDYDDMPYLPVINNRLKNHYDKYDFILVDEAQDLNTANIQLILGCLEKGGRIIAVGDRHQSLYGFRGADTEAIPRLIEMLSAKTLPLSITYRCPRLHVERVKYIVPHIEAAETAIDGLISTMDYEDLIPFLQEEDMVLCRTNAPLVKPAFDCIKRGLKAIIRGANIGEELVNFIERFEAQTLAQLEILMAEYVEREVERLLNKNKEMQAENLRDKHDTILTVANECKTVYELISKLQLLFSDDNAGVVFSSVHRAKGLEAQRIFLLHEELMPHPKAKQDWEQVQEMNAIYVAGTRSLSELYIVRGEESVK